MIGWHRLYLNQCSSLSLTFFFLSFASIKQSFNSDFKRSIWFRLTKRGRNRIDFELAQMIHRAIVWKKERKKEKDSREMSFGLWKCIQLSKLVDQVGNLKSTRARQSKPGKFDFRKSGKTLICECNRMSNALGVFDPLQVRVEGHLVTTMKARSTDPS